MFRKVAYGVAAIGALSTMVFGRDVWSYARTWGKSVRETVKQEVPIDFEIARARELIEHLVPDIKNCMHVIAEQEVDIDVLTSDLSRKETELSSQKDVLQSRTADLKTGAATFQYASHTYSADQVRNDLAKRFDRYKVSEETLKKERQVLEARRKALQANRDKLDNMLAAKTDLELQLEQLEARLKVVQAAETVSLVSIDDSELTRAKKLIRELNKQLDVREKVMAADNKLSDLIPTESKAAPPANLEAQIEAHFVPKGDSTTAPEMKVVNLDQLMP